MMVCNATANSGLLPIAVRFSIRGDRDLRWHHSLRKIDSSDKAGFRVWPKTDRSAVVRREFLGDAEAQAVLWIGLIEPNARLQSLPAAFVPS
ncbi:hypothetical protein A6U87_21270 [Rhizobium sp. AC44/96]|nr:hypothetical protein A6U87_21270 [Rhizobium sp. AC44/96]